MNMQEVAVPRERKPPERRQNRATKDLPVLAAVVDLPSAGPDPDTAWLEVTKTQWSELWASPLASELKGTDMPGLYRCFEWRDEQRRCRLRAKALRKQADAAPLVDGSKGQPVPNGLYDIAQAQDAEALAIESRIVALEDRLALSPKARLSLGVTVAKGVSLQAQNAQIARAIQEAMRDAPDPRASVGVTATHTA